MKWLVTGGRKFADIRFVYDALDGVAREHGLPAILIHGAAGIPCAVFGKDKFI